MGQGQTSLVAALVCFVLLNSPAWALSRYEYKGLARETIVLTPYEDGSVNLSFDKGPPEVRTTFEHHGNVFTAEFKLDPAGNNKLLYILDTIAKNGYEVFYQPSKAPAAAKMTCSWFAD